MLGKNPYARRVAACKGKQLYILYPLSWKQVPNGMDHRVHVRHNTWKKSHPPKESWHRAPYTTHNKACEGMGLNVHTTQEILCRQRLSTPQHAKMCALEDPFCRFLPSFIFFTSILLAKAWTPCVSRLRVLVGGQLVEAQSHLTPPVSSLKPLLEGTLWKHGYALH